jgi:hypothetical protein
MSRNRYHNIELLRKSLRTRLWIGGIAIAAFVALVLIARAPTLDRMGYDFLPFYTAGTFVREGNPRAMYDLNAIRAREKQIAAENGLDLGNGFGPFWNPPFYALPFAPLSMMSFRAALLTWLTINLAAAAISLALLCRLLGAPDAGWRTWGLIPLLALASSPCILALTHGQNTFCSLLLLTLATLAWRSHRPIVLGLVLGLLSYKPQLAAVVGVVALVDLGWKVALGALISGGALLLTMPGTLGAYFTALPHTLHFMQIEHAYLWERHATLKAFWRLLIQGYETGEANLAVNVLTILSSSAIGLTLLIAAWRGRLARVLPDRLIAATIATMPLVMPFYFDYDLLLLTIPAVLMAKEARASRMMVISWTVFYVCLIINPDVAERTRVNVAVPLLAWIATMLIRKALQPPLKTPQCEIVDESPAAKLALRVAA